MPVDEGGLGYPMLDTFSSAMLAKNLARLFGPAALPWQPLVRKLLADPRTGLATWVVTAPGTLRPGPDPTRDLPAHLGRWYDYARAFAALAVSRIVLPADQGFHSVLAEPLFYNDLVGVDMLGGRDRPGLWDLLHGHARGWRYLRDVYAAIHDAQRPRSLALEAAIAVVLSAVPAAWRAHLLTHPPPAAQWECALVPAPLVQRPAYVVRRAAGFQGPAGEAAGGAAGAGLPQPQAQAFWVLASGRLMPLLPGAVAPVDGVVVPLDALQWLPAAVADVRKPRQRLSVAEYERLRQRQEGPRPQWPTEQWLLGPWDEVWLDPTVWGWLTPARPVCIADYTVKDARLRLTTAQWARYAAASPEACPGALYMPRSGVFPRFWGHRPAAPPPGGDAAVQYDATALVLLEQQWQRTFTDLQRVDAGGRPRGEGAAEAPPAYFRPYSPRPAPRERQVQSQPDALPVRHGAPLLQQVPRGADRRPVGVDCRAVWRRLRDPALQRTHRVVAWRLLHGSVMVNALRMRVGVDAVRPFTPDDACCPLCAAAGRGRHLETVTHAFMDCPDVAPALDWLLAAYAALTGEPVPRDSLAILADADWRWRPAHPTLWLRLRVTFLGCVWAARGSGARGGPLAVVEAVVGAVARGVRRDWLRVMTDVRAEAVGIVPTVWFRGRSPALSERAFRLLWPDTGGWFLAGGTGRHVVVRLSPSWPVPVPVFGPAPAPVA